MLAETFLIRFMGYIAELVKGHTVRKKFRERNFCSRGFTWELNVEMCFLLTKFNKAELSTRILVFKSTFIQGSFKAHDNNLKLELHEHLPKLGMVLLIWKRGIITSIRLTFSIF